MESLKELISRGESSKLQFKEKFPGQFRIAEEMIAFANSRGGTIVFGVKDKTGEIVGLGYDEVQHISNEVANAANEQIRPTIYVETRTEDIDGKTILAVDVAEGINKPYKNLQGVIYVKQGPDKRRITENMEILRLFHESRQYFPDEEPIYGTGAKDIYDKALSRFLYKGFKKTKDDFDIPVETLERNLRIVTADGQMTLAGLLFFAEHPEYYRPQFIIKAVAFVGNYIGGTQYRDSKDIMGDMVYVYEEALRFCEGNLHHIQAGQSFNSIGVLEVSRIALEELIQNAITHRSYLVDAPIRLLIFDDRIEIINPGALAGRLTVENIKYGESYQRNPLLASFCARGMNYRGLGSGIVRALQDGADIEFVNNDDTNTFKAILHRKDLSAEDGGKKTDESGQKTENGCMENGESGQKSGQKIPEGGQKIPEGDQKTDEGGQKSTKGGQKSTKGGQNGCMKTAEGCMENEDGNQNGSKKTDGGGQKSENLILRCIRLNPKISRKELSETIGIAPSAIQKHIENLKAKGIIKRVGPDKGGYWEIIQTND